MSEIQPIFTVPVSAGATGYGRPVVNLSIRRVIGNILTINCRCSFRIIRLRWKSSPADTVLSMPDIYRIPGAFERAKAEKALPPLRDLLDTGTVTHKLRLVDENGEREVEVPAIGLWVLQHALEEIAKGNGAQVVPVQAELTTQEAADLLNVSRPYLIRLAEAGAIPFTKVGRHRRLRLLDVVAYKTKRDAESAWMMNALAEQGQSLGVV